MDKPAVSVLMTTYNRSNYIKEAIDSVLNQSYKNFELIIIDDGSTDNTFDIVKSIKDRRISYYYQDNSGQNSARNTGIILSDGEYIAMIDSDDIWEADKLKKQVEILDKYNEIGLVFCGTVFINQDNEIVYKKPLIDYKGDVLKKLLLTNFLYNGSCPLFRRAGIVKTGMFDTSFERMTDWEFYLRYALYNKFWGISEYLLRYRIHDDTMSSDFEKYQIWGFKIIDSIFSNIDFPEKYQKLRKKAYAMRYRYMGIRCFEKRLLKEARNYFNKAFKLEIWTFLTGDMPIYYILSLFPIETLNFARLFRKYLNKITLLQKIST
jgi:glycosyltransferase involved in cell wall biosynthesis